MKKAISLLVVVCMLTTCLAVVGASDVTAEKEQIKRDDVVTIDVTKTFSENSSQLAKLGITDSKKWQYDSEHSCNVMTLDNVNYTTSANVAIVFTAPADKENPTIGVKVSGTNTITSGSNAVAPTSMLDGSCATGILTYHPDANGQKKNDFKIAFVGDGEITVSNVAGSDTIGSSGIEVTGNLLVREKAKVIAKGGNIDYVTKAPSVETNHINIYSVGAYVNGKIDVKTENDGILSLYGIGGNVDVYFTTSYCQKENDLYSEGMNAKYYDIRNSNVYGKAGCVNWSVLAQMTFEGTFKLYADSAGISTRGEAIPSGDTSAYISNSRVVGTGDRIKGRDVTNSIGIELGAKDKIVIENSIIIGNAKVAESVFEGQTDTVYATTSGIVFYGVADINGSYIEGVSGKHAIVSNSNSKNELEGIHGNNDMTVRNSIVLAYARGAANEQVAISGGITLYKNNDYDNKANLNVIDSDIYSTGKTTCILAAAVKCEQGYRICCTYNDEGKRTDVECTSQKIMECKIINILYKYDVITLNEQMNVIDFKRCNISDYKVQPYTGICPNGEKWVGYTDIDGNKVAVGTNVKIDEPYYLVASFEPIEKSESSNGWIVWVIVIVAIIAIALLTICFYMRENKG